MNEQRLDDFIKNKLQEHASHVPANLFARIQADPAMWDASLDGFVNEKLADFPSPVAADIYERVENDPVLLNQSFDAFIAGTISETSSDVPADMFERIFPAERKRRPVLWWAAALLLLLLGGAGMYKYSQRPGGDIAVDDAGANQQQPNNRNSTGNNDGGISSGSGKGITPPSAESGNGPVTNNDGSAPANNNGSGTDHFNPQQNKQQHKGFAGNTGQDDQVTNGAVFSKKNKNRFGKSTANTNGNYAADDLLNAGNPLLAQDAAQASDFERSALMNRMSFMQRLRMEANASALNKLKASVVIPCPTFGDDDRPFSQWFGEAYVSGLYPIVSLPENKSKQLGGDSVSTELTSRLSWNSGFNIGTNLGRNLLVKAGVQYNQWNQQFKYTNISERRFVTTVSVRQVILAPGDTIYIRDTTYQEMIGKRTRVTGNRYTSIDVPLIFAYRFGGENLQINANLGVIANITTSYKGEIADSSSRQYVSVANYNGKALYKRNIGLGVYVGASVLKPINDRVSIYLEPHARINITNMASNAAWFKQKLIVPGISAGIRYQFNNSRQRR